MMSSMRVVILAGGTGKRWDNHGGVPKHLSSPDGAETLLARTVRLAAGRRELIVLADDPRYAIADVRLVSPCAPHGILGKFLSAIPLVHDNDVTTLLWGDVWFSADAMRTVLAARTLTWHGRRRRSARTGKDHAELFALTIAPGEGDALAESLGRTYARLLDGTEWHYGGTGFTWHRTHHDLQPRSRDICDEVWHNIDDFTDDFDEAADSSRWRQRWLAAGCPGRA